MNEAQLRAQFEKLVRDKPDQRYTLDQVLPGIYKDKEVHAAWEGYLAGYAARAAVPPEGETNGNISIRNSDNRVGDSMLSSRDGRQVEEVASPAMSAELLKKVWPNCEHPDKVLEFVAALTAEVERLRGALQEISVRSDALVRDEHVSKTFAAGMLGEHARAALESTTQEEK